MFVVLFTHLSEGIIALIAYLPVKYLPEVYLPAYRGYKLSLLQTAHLWHGQVYTVCILQVYLLVNHTVQVKLISAYR